MSDDEMREQPDIGTKVHGDKYATGGAHTAATNPGAAGATGGDAGGINADHPDRASEPGSGGLLPGSYEQAGGEAGRSAGAPPGEERIRAAGSHVPDPDAHPEQRQAALDIAAGRPPHEGGR